MSRSATFRRFVLVVSVSVVVLWDNLAATLGLALTNDAYTHIILILPVAAALVVMNKLLRDAQPVPSIRGGLPLLVLAAMVACYSKGLGRLHIGIDESLALSMFAFVVWWIGAFVLCFGTRLARMNAFPLCFLFWLVPIPTVALNWIVKILQQGSAAAAHGIFAIVGIPVTQDGLILSIPGLSIQVAAECSSIRSSLLLAVTTLVLCHLLLRSFWGKALIALAILPLAILKNGVRIFTLSILGAYVNPDILNSPLHHQGGIVFFLASLIAVFALLWVVGQIERKTWPRTCRGALVSPSPP